MFETIFKFVARQVGSRVSSWIDGQWKYQKAKGALVHATRAPKLELSKLVPERLKNLAKENLPEEFDKPTLREWMSDKATQDAFVRLYEAHNSGHPNPADALDAIGARFEHLTGDRRELASPYIGGIVDFFDAVILGSASSGQTALLRLVLRNVGRSEFEDIPSIRNRAKPAAKALIERGKSRWHYPGVVVPVRFERIEAQGSALPDEVIIGLDEILKLIEGGANLFLEGEAGAGKTTALIEICTLLANDDRAPLPIFLDAATWATSGRPLLDHIAGFGSFLAIELGTGQLARLREAGQLLIVMNGWNEIGAARQFDARNLLQEYLVGATAPRFVIATRTATDSLGIPTPKRLALLGFGWEQQKSLVRQVLDDRQARELIDRLRADDRLRSITRNPLVLSGVISLQKEGQAIPDNLYDLIEAIVVAYEKDNERAATLKEYPIRNCQRSYAKAMAAAMNSSAATLLADSEANQIVHTVGSILVTERRLQQAPEPLDLVSELCNKYLLQETDASTIRFAHQRFQEYFAATVILERLDLAVASEPARKAFQIEILNSPFWEDALNLVATKLAIDKERLAQRKLLVELAIPVELAYAARLAGEVQLGPSDGPVWAALQQALEKLYNYPATEAKEYALECMVETKSSVFADHLWKLLEDDETENHRRAYRITSGLTIDQLGTDAAKRIASWPEERWAQAILELGRYPDNFSYVATIAQSEVPASVRIAAIERLSYYGRSDTALQAWRSSPVDVKESTRGLAVALDLWSPAKTNLTQELAQLARTSSNADLKRSIGLKLLGHASEIGQNAARDMLSASNDRLDSSSLAQFVRGFDPQFVRDVALSDVWKKREIQDWAKNEIASLPRKQREDMFDSALDQISKTERESFDISAIAVGASKQQIETLLDEGQRYVVAWVTTRKTDKTTQARRRAVERSLHHVSTSLLVESILSRIERSSYDEVAWLLEIVDSRVPDPTDPVREKSSWKPATDDLDRLIEAAWMKRDPRAMPHCTLEMRLASIASKIDPKRYLPFLLEVVKREAHAWITFEEALRQWSSSQRGERPMNPANGSLLGRALLRCGIDAFEGLFALKDEPGAEELVLGVLTSIVASPWSTHRDRYPFENSVVEDHRQRRQLGRVFLEPEDVLQLVADKVATLLIEKLAPVMSGAVLIGQSATTRTGPNFFPMSKVAALLARVPSTLAEPVLNELLKRTDIGGYTYLSIAQGILRQGAVLRADILPGLLGTWVRESSASWIDDSKRHLLSKLGLLHLFVEPVEQGIKQLDEILPDLLKNADYWHFVRELENSPDEAALELLLKLPRSPQETDAFIERIVSWLAKNIDHASPSTLLRLVSDGTIFQIGAQRYRFERDVAGRLGLAIAKVPELLEQLFEVIESRTDPADANVICAILSDIDDSRVRLVISKYLDEKYGTTAKSVAQSLMDRFVREEPDHGGAGWYEIRPEAANDVRSWLFELASSPSPAKRRARAILLKLEQNRQETGRPSDEPRHPKLDSGQPWPVGMYVDDKPTQASS